MGPRPSLPLSQTRVTSNPVEISQHGSDLCRGSERDNERTGDISKQGDRYLRRLLVIGATAVVQHARQQPHNHPWIMRLLAKNSSKLVAVAVSNKIARIAWAPMA